MAPAPWISEASVTLATHGKDEASGKVIDVEVAIPMSVIDEVIRRLGDRAERARAR